ncbi:MAG TPA: glycosyltransferase [Crinalium sp.]
MKIAIQNPFFGQFVAETELSRRIYLAAKAIAWEATEVATSTQIKAFQPDFVIALHNNSPKLSGYPTYGCIWSPASFFEGTEQFVKHTISYDGYLIASKTTDRWLHHLLHNTSKVSFSAPFYPSYNQTDYQAPNLENPRLVYIGSNWDGARFQALFEGLDAQPYMEVYGNAEGWKHLQFAYRGALPYDGFSVLKTLNQAGVGLCLHREEHRRDGLPSMRIFEVVASGAIAICGDHPFIRKAFGDAVLYVDPDAAIADQLEQISQHMRWIGENPSDALAMSKAAHAIFLENYTLEKLLLGILPYHERLVQDKGFIKQDNSSAQIAFISEQPSIQYIVQIEEGTSNTVPGVLDTIVQQTYANKEVIVIKAIADSSSNNVLQNYAEKIKLNVIEIPSPEFRSTTLWAGLNAVDADYFAVMGDHTLLHPNHTHSLISILEQNSTVGVAYSGALRITEPEAVEEPNDSKEWSELSYFHPFNLNKLLMFEPFVVPYGFMGRRSLLSPILQHDPQLNEWGVLCLLLHLAKSSKFAFSYDVTCEVVEREADIGRSLFQESRNFSNELARLKFIFWHQEFAPGKSLQSVHESYLEQQRLLLKINRYQADAKQAQAQLQEAQAVITAMKTSKFWKLRDAWLQVKRVMGLRE